jgi:Sugar-transfer associated ATP-grasp
MLAKFSTSALNTIRLCTYRSSGDLHVLEAKLKLGKRGSIADTRGHGVPILLESQTLTTGASRKIEDLPFSIKSLEPGAKNFVGFKVPFFDEAVSLGKKVHGCFPDIFSLGHDIAILPDGPDVIETNHSWADNQKKFGQGMGANRFYIESILKTIEVCKKQIKFDVVQSITAEGADKCIR